MKKQRKKSEQRNPVTKINICSKTKLEKGQVRILKS